MCDIEVVAHYGEWIYDEPGESDETETYGSPINWRMKYANVNSVVPSKSANAIRAGTAALSGSTLFFQRKGTNKWAEYKRIDTCTKTTMR